MPKGLTHLLDHYASPKIISGPYASSASADSRAQLHRDRDYQELRERLVRAGVFAPARWSYAWRMVVLVGAYVSLFGYLISSPSTGGRFAACIALGVVHTLCNFLAHDISHGAVSKHAAVTEVTGQLFNSLLTGFSFTFFRRSHTLHHYHPNEDGYDPDTISGLWSVTARGARTKRGFGRATTRVQHLVIPFLYVLWGAALKLQGIMFAVRNPRAARADLVLLVLHFAAWGWIGGHAVGLLEIAVDYAVMTMVVGLCLGLIFPVGHVGRELGTHDTGSFLHQQLATTRNVTSSPVRDRLFMGLNSQIEHHLFPWVPSMRLGEARVVVRQFCAERGFPYEECSHGAAIAAVMLHLRQMSTLTSPPASPPASQAADIAHD